MEQLQKDIKTNQNIPPTASGKKRTSWNQAAIKAAEASLREEYWQEYASLGRHEPLPADLNQEVAFIIHVGADKCELVPLYIKGLEPAVRGLTALNQFLNNKLIVGDPISPYPDTTLATPSQVASTQEAAQDSPAPEALLLVKEDAPAGEATYHQEPEIIAPDADLRIDSKEFASSDLPKNIDFAAAREILKKAEDNGTAIPEPSEEELPPVIDDFQPEPPTSIPVAEPAPNAQRIKIYRERIANLPVEAKQKLAFEWPAGVPTFKKSGEQTAEELDQIDTALWKVESEFTPAAAEQRGAENVMAAFGGTTLS